MKVFFQRNKFLAFILAVLFFAIAFVTSLEGIDRVTSTDNYCMSCHIHPHSESTWKQASHHNNKSGVVVHCIDCHLPPKHENNYWSEKINAASRDLYSYWFKDLNQINWDQKSELAHAKKHVFNESCINCHENLFPLHLSKEGDEAHLHYKHNQDKLDCINCHLDVGHGSNNTHKANPSFLQVDKQNKIFKNATKVDDFSNFEEQIPGTDVSFEMIAIQPNNKFDSFFIGKTEISWNEYKIFLSETESEGRIDDLKPEVDAISGATPPFGDPSHGWGMEKRPAITMTWHAANTYCKWLSAKTGKKYRLPTKEEWIYACNGDSTDDFFFGGQLEDYQTKNFPENLIKKPSEKINDFVVWSANSKGKTALPKDIKSNPFGLLNMLGNVKEFCSNTILIDNKTEHIIMGGSFKSELTDLLLTKVDYTKHETWLITDPQIPKSIWWYSDCNDVGFRVVCEFNKVPEN